MISKTTDGIISDSFAPSGWREARWIFVACLVLFFYYAFLLCNGTISLLGRESGDLVFGSMLDHLLRGDFGVDAAVIGPESFTRDGKTYSYYGIVPALLRLPAMLFFDVTKIGLARPSCLIAMTIYVGALLRMLLLIHRSVSPARRSNACLVIMAAAICFSGPEVYLLGSAWFYHEPVFWASAFGAVYNFVLLRAVLTDRGFTTTDWALLAGLSGLALNTRGSVGVALALTTSLLIMRNMWIIWRSRPSWRNLLGAISDRSFIVPVAILTLFTIVVGFINFERWGNPFTFVNYRYYDMAAADPHHVGVIMNYGVFNVTRIPISLLYYSTGLPYFLTWRPLFSEYLLNHFYGIEAPPFFAPAIDPLTIVLVIVGIYSLIARPPVLANDGVAVLRLTLLGGSSAIVLVCAAMYLAMRYRMDFSPFMTIATFIGYRMLADWGALSRRSVVFAGLALCLLGIVGSHYMLLVHKVWTGGQPMELRLRLLPYAPFAHGAFPNRP